MVEKELSTGSRIGKQHEANEKREDEKTKVGWSYMDPLVYGQDAWPSRCCRMATSCSSSTSVVRSCAAN